MLQHILFKSIISPFARILKIEYFYNSVKSNSIVKINFGINNEIGWKIINPL